VLGVGALVALALRATGSVAARLDRAPIGPLVAIQVAAFLGQELLERVLAGAPLSSLVAGHVLAIGVVVQVLIATGGALLLRWLVRAAVGVSSLRPAAGLRRPGALVAVPVPVASAIADPRLLAVPDDRGPPRA
jgi:hypothetical protein